MGQTDLNDYGAQDLGIDDPGNDLGVHQDMADLQGDNGVDFNNDNFGGDDGYAANDLGNAYDGITNSFIDSFSLLFIINK